MGVGSIIIIVMGGDLALSLGGLKKISRTRFPNDLFRKKIILVIPSTLSLLSEILNAMTVDPFSRKTYLFHQPKFLLTLA